MPQDWDTWRIMIIIGICGIFDQYLITLAFQYEKAGPISVVRTFNIVLSFIWEVLLLNEEIQLTSVLGACLICSCVIVLALVKWNKESPETFESIRRRLCCFCPSPQPMKDMKKKPKSLSTTINIDGRHSLSKQLSGSNESIDSITVQNTVNSNAILLMKSDDEDDNDIHTGHEL